MNTIISVPTTYIYTAVETAENNTEGIVVTSQVISSPSSNPRKADYKKTSGR